LREKNITDIELINVDLFKGEHRTKEFRQKSPFAQVPALELADGRVLTESRAICHYLESLYPEPNLFGATAEEAAFIEMWDRRIEFLWLMPLAWWLRHGHPAFAALEAQIEELGPRGEKGFRRFAKVLNRELESRDFIAGDRFTVADITAFATMGFSRVAKWKPDAQTMPHLHAWRGRILARPCGGKA
jgi:glutathione S-transferase